MTPDARAPDASGSKRWRFRWALVIRCTGHLAVWAPFLYALTTTLLRGWVAVGDDAVTALRSWDALSAHGPLVGAPTRLAHGVYDLGPMEYWLLAVPVHVDPARGMWWGATLWCMIAGSLAIEAASSAAGGLGTVIAAGMILGIVAWIPPIATWYGPVWNPWFGTMFFIAALAACWAVLSGRRPWWPVLAVTGSVAAQAHDMYIIGAVLLVFVGFIAVVADSLRSRKYRWAVTGVIVGLACWIAPLIQQFTSRTGNLTAILNGLAQRGRGAGISFGLKALTAATQPPACWWQPLARLSTVGSRQSWFGVMQLIVVALALIIAIFVLRSRRTAALAGISLGASVAALITLSSIPASIVSASTLYYMLAPLFPVGLLSYLTVAAVLILAGRQAMSWLRRRKAMRGEVAAGAAPARTTIASWGLRIAALVAVPLIASASYGTTALVSRVTPGPQRIVMRAVSSGSRQIEHAISARRVTLAVVGDNVTFRRRLAVGLAYALRTAGYVPELLDTSFAMRLGPEYGTTGALGTPVTVSVHDKPGRKTRVVAHIGWRVPLQSPLAAGAGAHEPGPQGTSAGLRQRLAALSA